MSADLPDLSSFFTRYEALAQEADAVFEHVRSQFPQEVICKEGCSSCCHALFDLSLVETLYVNKHFLERFSGVERFSITSKAGEIDRKIAKIKRQAFKDSQAGKDSNEILQEMAATSVRCPLLDDNDSCTLYEFRPITCRFYGIPTSIGGKGHTCGKTGFIQGKAYPTVKLDQVQERLAALSKELADSLGSSYTRLETMYVPVSSALITEYTAEYLGIGGIPKEEKD